MDAIHPDEYEQVGMVHRATGHFVLGFDRDRLRRNYENVHVKREPAPQAEPHRCPNCGSTDPNKRRYVTSHFDPYYGRCGNDAWHTEGTNR